MNGPAYQRAGRLLKVATVVVALSGLSLGACTISSEGGEQSLLTALVGINGLLADPAATVHRPSASDTIDLLWAARLLGIAPGRSPDAEMLGALIDGETPAERQDLRLRWYAYVGDSQGTANAIAATRRGCGGPTDTSVDSRWASDDCERVAMAMWSFLRVTSSAALAEFEQAFPTLRGAACPATRDTLDEQFQAVLCGSHVTDSEAFDKAVARAFPAGGAIDSRALWTAAAVGARLGSSSHGVRELVSIAIGRSQVNGIYFDEIPVQGTLLTTWALLHLAGNDRSGLDTQQLVRAISAEPVDAPPDRVLLARASLTLLGARDRLSLSDDLILKDPDGPYNPFVALAARDAGELGSVRIGFTLAQARLSPERLASFVLTDRIVTGRPTRLDAADVGVLRRLAAASVAADAPANGDLQTSSTASNAQSRSRLLGAVALAAAGVPTSFPDIPTGCRGAAWLVDTGGSCDIRASLLVAFWHEFTSRSGVG